MLLTAGLYEGTLAMGGWDWEDFGLGLGGWVLGCCLFRRACCWFGTGARGGRGGCGGGGGDGGGLVYCVFLGGA